MSVPAVREWARCKARNGLYGNSKLHTCGDVSSPKLANCLEPSNGTGFADLP
jgi:hypothetical protein